LQGREHRNRRCSGPVGTCTGARNREPDRGVGHAAFFADPHGRYAAQVRQALGDQTFTAAFQHGADITADQAIAYALGDNPIAAPAPAPAAPAVLTPRQCQVAELVAQGLSNRDIAAKLVIAQRTAESHVENILTKGRFDLPYADRGLAPIRRAITVTSGAPLPSGQLITHTGSLGVGGGSVTRTV
jgi:DNA-binding CsgD family transcriptional regulator